MPSRRLLLAVSLPALMAFSAMPASAETLKVVASFTVLADVVKQVGGDHVEVKSLVGPNGDPHEFEPSPTDAKNLKAAFPAHWDPKLRIPRGQVVAAASIVSPKY